MKKKLIGFILCGLILATAAGCSDTPTQVGQINNSSMESADVTSDREDKDNSDDFTAEKDQMSQTADSASSESQSEIPAEKKEESAVPPVTNTDKTEKDSSSSNSTAESNPTISEQTNSETAVSAGGLRSQTSLIIHQENHRVRLKSRSRKNHRNRRRRPIHRQIMTEL